MNKTFDLWDSETKTSLPVEASKAGHEWKARCPKHADNTPSLSINEEKKRFHCFGCNFSGSLYDASRDPANKKARTGKRIVATYDYRDENGKLISQTVRYDPKDFKQRRPDGNGDGFGTLRAFKRSFIDCRKFLRLMK